MKYLKSFVVVVLLFGLPAGSWYFLQHGLEWRRVKRDQLLPKGHIIAQLDWTKEETALIEKTFKGKTTLFVSGEMTDSDKVVIEQFKDAYTFQSKTLSDLPSLGAKLSGDNDYLLIDTGMVVRQLYTGTDETVLARMIEDIALIAPQRKEKDIRLRSQPDAQ